MQRKQKSAYKRSELNGLTSNNHSKHLKILCTRWWKVVMKIHPITIVLKRHRPPIEDFLWSEINCFPTRCLFIWTHFFPTCQPIWESVMANHSGLGCPQNWPILDTQPTWRQISSSEWFSDYQKANKQCFP